jgi:hypothetical protein
MGLRDRIDVAEMIKIASLAGTHIANPRFPATDRFTVPPYLSGLAFTERSKHRCIYYYYYYYYYYYCYWGHTVTQLVEALRYKPQGRRVRIPIM